MSKRRALGMGMDALMGGSSYGDAPRYPERGAESQAATSEPEQPGPAVRPANVYRVEIDKIDVNPYQPRTHFSEEDLAELVGSVKQYGLIQPITVRHVDGRFQIISGERRFRACQQAGITDVPAYVLEANEQSMAEMALVENIQRVGLNAMETAFGFQRLVEVFKMTPEQIGQRVGKDRSTVTNFLRLLGLPYEAQKALRQDLITMGHARSLLSLESNEDRLRMLERIIKEGMTVREVEQAVKQPLAPPSPACAGEGEEPAPIQSEEVDPAQEMQHTLERKLGWGVSVKGNARGGGRIVISYRSEGERLDLMRRLGNLPDKEG